MSKQDKSEFTFTKVKPSTVQVDARIQRELDIPRAKAMAKAFDPKRVGVPVLSKRADGSYMAIDGQHRLAAAVMAGRGDIPMMCEVHTGVPIEGEAELFLALNGARKSVLIYERFKNRLVAKEPVALEIQAIVQAAGLRVAKAQAANCICAIKAVESVHLRKGNLAAVLRVLRIWSDGDANAFDGELVKAFGAFLAEYPELDEARLLKVLQPVSPERVLSRIRRQAGVDMSKAKASVFVLRELYNSKRGGVKLAAEPPPREPLTPVVRRKPGATAARHLGHSALQ